MDSFSHRHEILFKKRNWRRKYFRLSETGMPTFQRKKNKRHLVLKALYLLCRGGPLQLDIVLKWYLILSLNDTNGIDLYSIIMFLIIMLLSCVLHKKVQRSQNVFNFGDIWHMVVTSLVTPSMIIKITNMEHKYVEYH